MTHHDDNLQALEDEASRWQPYTTYQDSGVEWLGDIPEHWILSPLFAVAEERNEKNKGNKENNVLSLSYGKIVRRNVETNLGLLPALFDTYQIVHDKNIILRLTDLQNDKRSLRVGLVKEKGIITSAYVCLDIKKLDALFTYYLLHSYDITKIFYSLGAGVRQTMKFDDLKRMPIVVPQIEEQEQIAAFLDYQTERIDTLIAKKQELIDHLHEKRAALISHAVTKGLNPHHLTLFMNKELRDEENQPLFFRY